MEVKIGYVCNITIAPHFALTWKSFDDFIGNYFAFFDLTHKIDFMVGKSALNATAIFLDFLGRIAIGYSVTTLFPPLEDTGGSDACFLLALERL